MTAPVVSNRFALDGIITTVDAVNAENELNRHEESVKQVAVADRIVITKSDLVDAEDLKKLEDRISTLNPGAPQGKAVMGEIDPVRLFDTGLYDPKTKSIDVQRWLRDEAYLRDNGHDHDHGPNHGHDHDHHHHNDVNRTTRSITAFCMTRDDPIAGGLCRLGPYNDPDGEKLLRIKGILNIAGRDKPIAVHGVQHMFHDPAELAEWPDNDRRSRIVFITRDLDRSVIEDKLDSLMEQAAKLDQ